jgi:heme iron utilization protein
MNQGSISDDLLQDLRQLWSTSFHGLLSTHSAKYAGYPFGSLLPICRDAKGQPLLMISHLAQHTRNLDADPRCSLTLTQPGQGDVQQWPRLTCLADAQPVTSSQQLERYYRYYPDSRRYHKELNFRLYRLLPKQFYFIAGFGSARWFEVSRLLEHEGFATADELELLYQVNAHEHALLRRSLEQRGVEFAADTHAVGADPRGLDIRRGDSLMRLRFDDLRMDAKQFLENL